MDSNRTGTVDLESELENLGSLVSMPDWSFKVVSTEYNQASSCETYACLKLKLKLKLAESEVKTRVSINVDSKLHYLMEGCPKLTIQSADVLVPLTLFVEASCLLDDSTANCITVKVFAFKKSNS